MKRRCNHPNHIGPRYLPVSYFHKTRKYKGVQKYATFCKVCKNRDRRESYIPGMETQDQERKKAYMRSRSRALTKLARIVPELYDQCFIEEMRKEGYTR